MNMMKITTMNCLMPLMNYIRKPRNCKSQIINVEEKLNGLKVE